MQPIRPTLQLVCMVLTADVRQFKVCLVCFGARAAQIINHKFGRKTQVDQSLLLLQVFILYLRL